MNYNKISSFAKINLSLNIISRRSNGFHNIESLVTFAKLSDEIKIRKIKKPNHKISFSGRFSKGIKRNNTVSKMLFLLEKNRILENNKFQIKIKKNIPQKAGLGGGSMNAASIIKYFISKKIITIPKNKIIDLAYKVGSDIPLGLEKKNSVLLKNGKILREDNKINYYVLITKPNFDCSTKDIYLSVKRYSKSIYRKKNKFFFKNTNLINSKNDLEKVVFKKYPKALKLKNFLLSLPNTTFVRMTGSGSAIVAYFKSKKSSKIAEKFFKRKYKNYWCIISKTI